jgi:spore germination cell wall hydrolase CwlJ-like protein
MIKGTLYVLVTMFALTIITLIVIGAGAIEPKEESKDSATTIIAEEDTSDIDNKTDVLYAEITTESSVDTEVIEIPGDTEVVTTEEIDEEIVPETTYDTSPDILHNTEDELFCLAVAVCREAGGASTEIQMMVANVIINRVCSDIYPDSVRGVITQRKQ